MQSKTIILFTRFFFLEKIQDDGHFADGRHFPAKTAYRQLMQNRLNYNCFSPPWGKWVLDRAKRWFSWLI